MNEPRTGSTPEERFAALVDRLVTEPFVTPPVGGSGFGGDAIRVNGKIFAMLVRGRLVVKLPRNRVDELVTEGEGVRFDANKGRPMREWLTVDPSAESPWYSLAREALAFVSRPGRPRDLRR